MTYAVGWSQQHRAWYKLARSQGAPNGSFPKCFRVTSTQARFTTIRTTKTMRIIFPEQGYKAWPLRFRYAPYTYGARLDVTFWGDISRAMSWFEE